MRCFGFNCCKNICLVLDFANIESFVLVLGVLFRSL